MKKTNIQTLSIVAIVAVVAIMGILFSVNFTKTIGANKDLAGQAIADRTWDDGEQLCKWVKGEEGKEGHWVIIQYSSYAGKFKEVKTCGKGVNCIVDKLNTKKKVCANDQCKPDQPCKCDPKWKGNLDANCEVMAELVCGSTNFETAYGNSKITKENCAKDSSNKCKGTCEAKMVMCGIVCPDDPGRGSGSYVAETTVPCICG